jgi:hypothetical protein
VEPGSAMLGPSNSYACLPIQLEEARSALMPADMAIVDLKPAHTNALATLIMVAHLGSALSIGRSEVSRRCSSWTLRSSLNCAWDAA